VAPGYAVYCSAPECVSVSSGPWLAVGGTSAATPLLAGGFALVDQQLRSHRRQPLGLANSLLYTIGSSASTRSRAFSDVVAGGNDVGAYISPFEPLGCCAAHSGFDDASGWGSVDLGRFAQLALQLQPPYLRLSIPPHQRPVSRRALLAKVGCEAACRFAAFADVRIGGSAPFLVRSRIYSLRRARAKVVMIRFSAAQLRSLRGGLGRHTRIVASIVGVLLDRYRLVVAKTPAKKLVVKA
jgi:hypothetical protein